MELVLEKAVRHGAFAYAISQDLRKIAISSENNIAIYSMPAFQKLTVVPVRRASSMVFLSDNQSLLILNTTGKIFLWNGESAESLGPWPVPGWHWEPIYYADDAHIFRGGAGGVWCYDVRNRSMKQIFSTEKEAVICRCDQGTIKALLFEYPPEDEQPVEILELSYDGDILAKRITNRPLQTRLVNLPIWSDDDRIAISTVAAPQPAKVGSGRVVMYEFTPEGRAVLAQDFWPAERTSRPHGMLYLLSKEGYILKTQKNSEDDDGDLYCGYGILAKCRTGDGCVDFLRLDSLRLIASIGKSVLANKNPVNPPTFVWFAPDNRVLVGSWSELLIFRMVL